MHDIAVALYDWSRSTGRYDLYFKSGGEVYLLLAEHAGKQRGWPHLAEEIARERRCHKQQHKTFEERVVIFHGLN